MRNKETLSLCSDIQGFSTILVSVVHSSKREAYLGRKTDGSYKIFLRSPPEYGKANDELLSFLKKETWVSWEIILWHTLRKKLCRKQS